MVLTRFQFMHKYLFYAFDEEELDETMDEKNVSVDDIVYWGGGIFCTLEGEEYLKKHPYHTLRKD